MSDAAAGKTTVEAPSTDSVADVVAPAPPRPRRRARFFVIYSCYILCLCWIGWKGYTYYRFGVPVTRSANVDDVWRMYYPELWRSKAVDADTTGNDQTRSVLLLGGSVLEQTAAELEKRLKARHGDRLRLYNVSRASHTTRDSMQKLQRLRERHFDLIIVYHGINDVRMNCCAPDDYRHDYTHNGWYASFLACLEAKSPIIPGNAFSNKPGLGPPDDEMLDYGDTIKTVSAFRHNLETILKHAASNDTPVVLMTFAYHLPADYTREKFEAGRLDYGKGEHRLSAELWGRPRNIAAAVDAHNRVIHELHRQYPRTLFIDQRKRLPGSGRNFSDCCHLTETGIDRFVAGMIAVIDQPD